MAKLYKKKTPYKGRSKEWCSKDSPITSTEKLDGRRKAGVYTGMFDGSKPILPLKPISDAKLSEQEERIAQIKARKLKEKSAITPPKGIKVNNNKRGRWG
jgi:hypothetical protein